ncbi:DUF4259 domain-containing protein [Streptomyces catenulae]|uniref:DUF4259 domain-containing protein n=1 Tax=Streptomyces catenulae TaxID=66875 RepID=A0ABV2YV45_9ACTN|nr:DUF4259 domain-containing protein [Streptomyces catenulae]
MGTWGTGPFGGDAAADLVVRLGALPENRRLFAVRTALADAVEERWYLDAPEGETAVAAAALLAAARPGGAAGTEPGGAAGTEPGGAGAAGPAGCGGAAVSLPRCVIPQPPPELTGLAVRALDRVLAPDSELAELWDESDSGPQWRASVAGLRAALGPAAERV